MTYSAGVSARGAAERIETGRLLLRKPTSADVDAIFERYAADPIVTRYVGWPRHQSVPDTHAFLAFSNEAWAKWPAGPYLIEARADGRLLGSTGLAFDSSWVAATGYVLARDAWGLGYATEALGAMVTLASSLAVHRIYALSHPDNQASVHVLLKCAFQLEARLARHMKFPNLVTAEPQDCLGYIRLLN
jgi:ribosomal-protein-alanine N-acetyltransferase